MPGSDSTRWSMIRQAAQGGSAAREAFAGRYEPVVRAYLGARWRENVLASEIDDAVQDVFVDCFRDGGVLDRADEDRPGGFRAFLYGVIRNVARRHEDGRYRGRERTGSDPGRLDAVEARDDPVSKAFDRAWARSMLRQAADLQFDRARELGPAAERRVELLRLRFSEGLPVREIARRWNEDPDRVHYHYKRAREEFKAALREVVRDHDPDTPVDEECERLLDHLG